jgi:predicted lipoprotein with Yx(FWY)xxD motif
MPDQEGTKMGMQRRLAVTGAIAATAMTLAGCGGLGNGSSSTDDAYGADSSQQGADQTQAAAPSTPKIKWTLQTKSTKKFGKIMVNGEGLTVYRFDGDTARPSATKCLGTCAEDWPPVTINSTNLVLKGFDATLLGRIKRPDGTWQLTLNGWPLYLFAQDAKAGDWKGQGAEGKWFVARPNGAKAAAKSAASAGGQESTGGESGSGSTGDSGSSGGSGGSSDSGGSGGDGGYDYGY